MLLLYNMISKKKYNKNTKYKTRKHNRKHTRKHNRKHKLRMIKNGGTPMHTPTDSKVTGRKRLHDDVSSHSKKKSSGIKKTKLSIRQPSIWKRLSPNKQTLCKKVPAKNNIVDKCDKYNSNQWFHHTYDITKVKQEDSPIYSFKENDDDIIDTNYNDLQDGIHNFILYLDEENDKYMLVTSFFNAIEYGSKHNMIALREKNTPDTFIISGEFKKDKDNITFHDVSSQYFLDNPCNIKKQMLITSIYDIMKKERLDKDSLTDTNLKYLKKTIIGLNNFTKPTITEINETDNFDDFIKVLARKTPSVKGVIHENYKNLITNLMTDAFERIFGFNTGDIKIKYVTNFKETEYKEQKDINTFMDTMCEPEHNIEFDVYNNDNCLGEKIGTTCSAVSNSVKK